MAAKETTLNELGEMLAYVVKHIATKDDLTALRTELKCDIADIRTTMATKADLAALAEQVAGIERDLKTIRRELNDLAEIVENIAGYRKEIDHAFDRIAAIERHLGIGRKIAA
jgi:predicted  nucleic acid-binding Zn-ribbon protein